MKIIPLFIVLSLLVQFSIAQDIILKTDKSTIKATVIEISDDNIKYKRFEMPNGPVYNIKPSNIISIQYKNGPTDIFNSTPKIDETVKQARSIEAYHNEEQIPRNEAIFRLPNIRLRNFNDKEFNLKYLPKYDNTVNVVYIHAFYWCVPCTKTLHTLSLRIDTCRGIPPYHLWAINVDEQYIKEILRDDFEPRDKFPYERKMKIFDSPNMHFLHDTKWDFMNALKISATPAIIFLDKNNNVVHAILDLNFNSAKIWKTAEGILNGSIYADERLYLNNNFEPCTKQEAEYYRTSVFQNNEFIVNYHYLNGSLLRSYTGSNILPGLKEGYTKAYFKNGQLESEGLNRGGEKIGLWKTYDEDGKLVEKKVYEAKKE